MMEFLIIAVLSSLLGIITSLHSLLIGIILYIIVICYLLLIKQNNLHVIVISLLIFIVYFLVGTINEKMRVTNYSGNEQVFLIKITKPLEIDGPILKGEVVDVLKKEKLMYMTRFKSEINKTNFTTHFKYPKICKIKGKLERPDIARNENAFDYRKFLYQNNIHWILKVDQFKDNECKASKPSFLTKLYKIREAGISYINSQFPEKSAPLVVALLFGERRLMEQTDIENFQKLGIIHLLAISGLHVGLISGMIYFSAIRLGVRRETILKVMLLLLPIYAFLTGAAPSVIRAVIMICFIIVTQLLKFAKLHPLNSICIAFLLFLFFKPFYIFYPGFQLSFLVSFSLIVSSSYILRRYKSTVSQLLVVSLIAQIVSLPIIAYHFYEISIFSTVMNIFFVPLFSMIILPLVIITFFLHLFSPFLSTPFILILTKLITFINKIAELFAQLPFATIVVGRPNSLLLASYFVVICTFLYNFEKTTNLYKNMRSFFLIIFVIIMQSLLLQYSPYGEVTFIDVGQGDSIFIKLPFNKGNYLIDTGGVIQYDIDQWERRRNQFDPGQHIIEPFLKSKGINRIDKLIISHGHLDHMGGAFYLVDNFKINEVVFPHVKSYTDVEKQFIQLIKENKIPLSIVKEGSKWQNDQAKFKVLAPTKETYHLMDQNNGSLVIFSKIGNLNWAFMGDLEEQGEKYLMKNNPNLNVDVLKVGHHGSNTSTSELLLNNINARYAVISAGINNRFGHPHDDVVARLNEKNIVIYRTDKNGSITYKFFYNRTGTFYKIIP